MSFKEKIGRNSVGGTDEIGGIVLFFSIALSIGTAIAMTEGLSGHWLVLLSMSMVSMGFIGLIWAIRWGCAKLMQTTISLKLRQSDHRRHATAMGGSAGIQVSSS
jgi:UDP-N-acetylmuramyl pentapeptide phosphotransferase/UDP-N-acetylglucosamine-1-phosphate transferase